MLVRFLAYSGCRIGEAFALRWSSLDLERRTVTICENISSNTGKSVLRPTKTYASRTIDIPCRLAEQLRDYRSESSTGDVTPLVFPNVKRGYLQYRNWRRYWDPATEQAGIGSRLYRTTFEPPVCLCSSTRVHHPKTFSCTWATHRSR
jgi:integrase